MSDLSRMLPGFVVLSVVAYGAYCCIDDLTKQNRPKPTTPLSSPATPVAGYVVVVSQSGCAPCERLRRELQASPLAEGLDIRYVDLKRNRQYKVTGTPTSIRFVAGKEVSRREGYMAPAEFVAWVTAPNLFTPVRNIEE